MELKINNILICKNSFRDLKKGVKYIICDIKIYNIYYTMILRNYKGSKCITFHYYAFTLDYKDKKQYIWNFFYSENDIRKIKLQKLQKNN